MRKLHRSLSRYMLLICTLLSVHAAAVNSPLTSQALMWQVPAETSDDDFSKMKSLGITVIQHFNIGKWSDPVIRDYLNRAEKHGLRVIVFLGPMLSHVGNKWKLTEAGKNFISKWKTHPAIYAWHTFDEPIAQDRIADKKAQELIYQEVKAIDANTPIIESLNLTTSIDWEDYFSEDAFDFLELHAYINRGIGKRQADLITNLMSRQHHPYPVFLTVRAFNGWTGRADLPSNGIEQQYRHFFVDHHIATNIGYYGWELGLYKGISQDPDLMRQFINVNCMHMRTIGLISDAC